MTSEPSFDPYAVLQVAPTCEPEVVHAAFRALALKYHPDHDATRRASQKMAELNRAYAILRDASSRAAHDRDRRRRSIAGVAVAAPPRTSASAGNGSGSQLTFGRYAGWGLRDLARHDPDYLVWLSRHSSGIRYRTEIYAILGALGKPVAA